MVTNINTHHKFLSKDDYDTTVSIKYSKQNKLNLEDDAAHVNMGDNWRMPTKEELLELYKLPHKYTIINGVAGIQISGKNNNSIFIPLDGRFDSFKYKFSNNSKSGYIWSSTITNNGAYIGHSTTFSHFTDTEHRSMGLSVRGVCK